MSKRLQVILDDRDMARYQSIARTQRLSLGEWVRRALASMADRSAPPLDERLQVLERAARYQFPTGDIDQMLKEIEAGRADDLR